MNLPVSKFAIRFGIFSAVTLTAILAALGCGSGGSVTNNTGALSADDTTSIAGPIDPTRVVDAETIPRDQFGRSVSPEALIFPSATAEERAHFARGLALFTNPALTAAAGQGPYFNQTTCLGCHSSQQASLTPTPASRAKVPAAFTLFGDYYPGSGDFNPRSELGGPILHTMHLPGYPDQKEPPVRDAASVRVHGNRTAPPYIARGLMEAIPDSEILQFKDPALTMLQFIDGRPIPGFENRNNEAGVIAGGSSVVRLSKFGLRAAGPTLLQFIVSGSANEVGLSSPFSMGTVVPVPQGGNKTPGLTADDIRDLRTMIRLIAPPARAAIVPGSSEDRGRILFGVDYSQPFGLAKDRKANCVSCHIPYIVTGQSPAEMGAGHLSNKRVYLFSDLLIHDMGQADADNAIPGQGRANGRMWRTTPLIGIGLIGPPFFHDGRVDAATIDSALDLSIDAHDNNGADVDSEAHASVDVYRNLPAEGVNSQRDIVNFMKTL